MGRVNGRSGGRIRPLPWCGQNNRPQGAQMADLAFVALTVAVFALVALVARGVGKL
jgi:hypothetical protein